MGSIKKTESTRFLENIQKGSKVFRSRIIKHLMDSEYDVNITKVCETINKQRTSLLIRISRVIDIK